MIDGHDVIARTRLEAFAAPASSPTATETEGPGTAYVVTVERATLDALCSRTENLGSALKHRTVRRYGDVPARFGNEKQFLDGLAAYLDTSGWSLLAGAELMDSATSVSTRCDAASQQLKLEQP